METSSNIFLLETFRKEKRATIPAVWKGKTGMQKIGIIAVAIVALASIILSIVGAVLWGAWFALIIAPLAIGAELLALVLVARIEKVEGARRAAGIYLALLCIIVNFIFADAALMSVANFWTGAYDRAAVALNSAEKDLRAASIAFEKKDAERLARITPIPQGGPQAIKETALANAAVEASYVEPLRTLRADRDAAKKERDRAIDAVPAKPPEFLRGLALIIASLLIALCAESIKALGLFVTLDAGQVIPFHNPQARTQPASWGAQGAALRWKDRDAPPQTPHKKKRA